MHAAIFDIDGTLIDSCGADDAMFIAAIRQVLGPVHIRQPWQQYEYVTDTGILADICRDNALEYRDAVSDAVMDAFLEMLHARFADKGPYREMPGARHYVQELAQLPHVRMAYATGGWRTSARLKLQSAGFAVEDVPLASASDHPDRTRIMLHALEQLGGPFDSVTYFGDGIWDQAATASLGWHFVPVGPKLGGLTHFGTAEHVRPQQRWRRD